MSKSTGGIYDESQSTHPHTGLSPYKGLDISTTTPFLDMHIDTKDEIEWDYYYFGECLSYQDFFCNTASNKSNPKSASRFKIILIDLRG